MMTIPLKQTINRNRNAFLGCGLIFLLVVIGVVGVIYWSVQQLIQAAHYPNAITLPDHSYTVVRSNYVAIERAYLTQEPLTAVIQHYRDRLNLSHNADGNNCINFRRNRSAYQLAQSTAVLICDTNIGRKIFVTNVAFLE